MQKCCVAFASDAAFQAHGVREVACYFRYLINLALTCFFSLCCLHL